MGQANLVVRKPLTHDLNFKLRTDAEAVYPDRATYSPLPLVYICPYWVTSPVSQPIIRTDRPRKGAGSEVALPCCPRAYGETLKACTNT